MLRRSTIFLTLAFAGLMLVNGSDAIAQAWARKMFKEFSHDFGDVIKGERPVHKFEIQNVFQEDIHIAGAHSSCGCTSVSVSKRVIKTWEKAEIVCQFNSPAFDGAKKATITVRFDRPYVGEVQLNIAGNIVRGSGLKVSPTSIDFGQVSAKSMPERTVDLTGLSANGFRILDVKSTFPHIKVQLRQNPSQPGRVNYVMTTRLKPSVPKGFNQGELYVVVQEGRNVREVPVPFSAKVVSGLKLSPEILTLSGVTPGQEIRKKVILKAAEPFRIVDVTCHSQAFRVKATKDAKKIHFVEVIYTGEDNAGRHECELSFFTDATGDEPNKLRAIVEIVTPEVGNETANNGS